MKRIIRGRVVFLFLSLYLFCLSERWSRRITASSLLIIINGKLQKDGGLLCSARSRNVACVCSTPAMQPSCSAHASCDDQLLEKQTVRLNFYLYVLVCMCMYECVVSSVPAIHTVYIDLTRGMCKYVQGGAWGEKKDK